MRERGDHGVGRAGHSDALRLDPRRALLREELVDQREPDSTGMRREADAGLQVGALPEARLVREQPLLVQLAAGAADRLQRGGVAEVVAVPEQDARRPCSEGGGGGEVCDANQVRSFRGGRAAVTRGPSGLWSAYGPIMNAWLVLAPTYFESPANAAETV